MSNNGQLHGKQKRFCEEYIVDLDPTQAAIRAGYSEKTAYSMGHENLRKGAIQSYIHLSMSVRSLRTKVTADRVLQELAKIAFAEEGEKTKDKLKALEMLADYLISGYRGWKPLFGMVNQNPLEAIAVDKEESELLYKELEEKGKAYEREATRTGSDTCDNGDYL